MNCFFFLWLFIFIYFLVACPKVVLLWSSLSSNAHQQSAQKKMNDLFIISKIRFEALDGSQPENKDNRNKFFNISNVRGKYPQIFIYTKDDDIKYIGMDEEIQVCHIFDDISLLFECWCPNILYTLCDFAHFFFLN